MISTEAATAALSVGEIAAMGDAELGQFMTKHRGPDGGYELPIYGWDKLSKDTHDCLIKRLKVQDRDLAQSPTACSRPRDLDDLDARLRRVSPRESSSLQPGSRTITSSLTPPRDPTIRETEAYHELINDGGRPLYPADLIQDIYRDPDSYAETSRPRQLNVSPISPSGIFQKQLRRWRSFRKWQNDNRGREDNDGGFPAYVERNQHTIQLDVRPRSAATLLVEIEPDPACLRSEWEDRRQLEHERQRRHCRESGCPGFLDYAEAVKRRLARHDFTQPFELDQDPKKQDKLTTWVEYLGYEYWWLDKYTGDIERLGPEHNELWQELVDKTILRPHETKEFVRTVTSGMHRETEKNQAIKVVQRAELEAERIYKATQENPTRPLIPKAKRISMLKHSTGKLLAAKRRLEQLQSRSLLITQFVQATFGYAGAKSDASRHDVFVQWVLDQVPLIEAETNPCKTNGPPLGSGGQMDTKRKLVTHEEPPERRYPKRMRINLEEPRLASAGVPSRATKIRRSPRIAACRDASRIDL